MYIRNSKLQSKTELSMLHTFKSYMYCMPDAFFTQWTLKKNPHTYISKGNFEIYYAYKYQVEVCEQKRIGKVTKKLC